MIRKYHILWNRKIRSNTILMINRFLFHLIKLQTFIENLKQRLSLIYFFLINLEFQLILVLLQMNLINKLIFIASYIMEKDILKMENKIKMIKSFMNKHPQENMKFMIKDRKKKEIHGPQIHFPSLVWFLTLIIIHLTTP